MYKCEKNTPLIFFYFFQLRHIVWWILCVELEGWGVVRERAYAMEWLPLFMNTCKKNKKNSILLQFFSLFDFFKKEYVEKFMKNGVLD